MMRNFFYFIMTLFGFLMIQMLLNSQFPAVGIRLQLGLLATLYLALYRGPVFGELFGFWIGLGMDTFQPQGFGSQAFVLTLIGYGIGRVSRRVDEGKAAAQFLLALLLSALNILALASLASFFEWVRGTGPAGAGFMPAMLPGPFVLGLQTVAATAVIAPLVFRALILWSRLWYGKTEINR